jgi:hypothetical protein
MPIVHIDEVLAFVAYDDMRYSESRENNLREKAFDDIGIDF